MFVKINIDHYLSPLVLESDPLSMPVGDRTDILTMSLNFHTQVKDNINKRAGSAKAKILAAKHVSPITWSCSFLPRVQ